MSDKNSTTDASPRGAIRPMLVLDGPPSEWFRFRLGTLMLFPVGFALLGAWRGREMAIYIPLVFYFALAWGWCRSLPHIDSVEAILRFLGFVVTGICGTLVGSIGVGVMFLALHSVESLESATTPQCLLVAGLISLAVSPGYWLIGLRPWAYCARWAFPAAWLALVSIAVWSVPGPFDPDSQIAVLPFAWVVAPVLFGVGCLADYQRWKRAQRKIRP